MWCLRLTNTPILLGFEDQHLVCRSICRTAHVTGASLVRVKLGDLCVGEDWLVRRLPGCTGSRLNSTGGD